MSTTTPTAPRICDECEQDETTEQHNPSCMYHPDNDDPDEYMSAAEEADWRSEQQEAYDDFWPDSDIGDIYAGEY